MDPSGRLSVAPAGEPEVSVVMLLYGGWELARRAIAALAENTEPSFELVLVDNASPDDTLQRVEAYVDGATIVRNSVNRGFGEGSNQGAEAARGRFLCFLNSDAIVQPDWLPPLLERLEQPGVGAAVPMFLNENGSVQEAGLRDRLDRPRARRRGRRRRSATSGTASRGRWTTGPRPACVVPRALFLEVGGFDDAFSPAYYEDSDLCFRLHERGLKTMYEPRSRVVHIRHGSGTSESARKLMEDHRDVFMERWVERLVERPRLVEVVQEPRQMVAARDADALDRILVIDDRVPHTDRGSGDPRMSHLLGELATLWPSARITLAATDGQEAERYAEPLLRQGIEVVCPPVDWDDWFEERRFHYGVVIVSRQQNAERFDGYLGLDPAAGAARVRHRGDQLPAARAARGAHAVRQAAARRARGRREDARGRDPAHAGGRHHLLRLRGRGPVHRRARAGNADVHPPGGRRASGGGPGLRRAARPALLRRLPGRRPLAEHRLADPSRRATCSRRSGRSIPRSS